MPKLPGRPIALPQKIEDIHRWCKETGRVHIETRFGYKGVNACGTKAISDDHVAGPAG